MINVLHLTIGPTRVHARLLIGSGEHCREHLQATATPRFSFLSRSWWASRIRYTELCVRFCCFCCCGRRFLGGAFSHRSFQTSLNSSLRRALTRTTVRGCSKYSIVSFGRIVTLQAMNGSIALDYARNRVGVSDRRAQALERRLVPLDRQDIGYADSDPDKLRDGLDIAMSTGRTAQAIPVHPRRSRAMIEAWTRVSINDPCGVPSDRERTQRC